MESSLNSAPQVFMMWMDPESVSLRNPTLSFQKFLDINSEPGSRQLRQGVTGKDVDWLAIPGYYPAFQ